jgi:hypothetical protein
MTAACFFPLGFPSLWTSTIGMREFRQFRFHGLSLRHAKESRRRILAYHLNLRGCDNGVAPMSAGCRRSRHASRWTDNVMNASSCKREENNDRLSYQSHRRVRNHIGNWHAKCGCRSPCRYWSMRLRSAIERSSRWSSFAFPRAYQPGSPTSCKYVISLPVVFR